MSLLGERAWALPGWLDRVLPNVDIEGESLPAIRPPDGTLPELSPTRP
jgi:RND superfamily putative drug exporter